MLTRAAVRRPPRAASRWTELARCRKQARYWEGICALTCCRRRRRRRTRRSSPSPVLLPPRFTSPVAAPDAALHAPSGPERRRRQRIHRSRAWQRWRRMPARQAAKGEEAGAVSGARRRRRRRPAPSSGGDRGRRSHLQ
ncbi:Os10g0468200 [Oryza sativa Japonica Group]|uniref:Os10g0468200 protein n=1 Tax=Oryza sativa subsp. japonica TaxID=39947 RepID=A0A0P0XVN6_ORYSJ|nr:hypothetical protein DAI22_10g127100 [Oryza sativa Japonica Group]BAT11229.1 Os10g0468200 [Oryza sativa Japonica Group]